MENKILSNNWYDEYVSRGSLVIKGDLSDISALHNTRRPYVLIRGKSVSVEEAKKIIVNEEPLFKGWDERYSRENSVFDARGLRGVLKNIFYRFGYSWLDTWLFSDGYIGGNILELTKYPEPEELIPGWVEFAERNKNVDMIVSYTHSDECPCYNCPFNDYEHKAESLEKDDDMFFECTKAERDRCRALMPKVWETDDLSLHDIESHDFYEFVYFGTYFYWHCPEDMSKMVEMTLQIKNGVVIVYTGDAAKVLYNKYNSEYGFKELNIMTKSIFKYDTCICDKQFVKECFELAGLPADTVDEAVSRDFISPFNEKAVVVTKDWIIDKHKQMCERLKLNL